MEGEFNKIPQTIMALNTVVSRLVRKAAFAIQGSAMESAPVDTGFLKNSIYVELHNRSTYGQGVSGSGEMLPEIPAAEDALTAYVAVGASYGVFVEWGTVHSPAQPYLTPAVELETPLFLLAMQHLEEDIGAILLTGIDISGGEE